LRYATLRVLLTAALGVFSALWLPRLLHVDPRYGALGLTGSAGVAGWIEFALLRRGLGSRIGARHLPQGLFPRLWGSALAAAPSGVGARADLRDRTDAQRRVSLAVATEIFNYAGCQDTLAKCLGAGQNDLHALRMAALVKQFCSEGHPASPIVQSVERYYAS